MFGDTPALLCLEIHQLCYVWSYTSFVWCCFLRLMEIFCLLAGMVNTTVRMVPGFYLDNYVKLAIYSLCMECLQQILDFLLAFMGEHNEYSGGLVKSHDIKPVFLNADIP